MRKTLVLVLALAVLAVALSPPAFAGEYNAAGKLGRGIANVFTGWLEVPAEVSRQLQKKGELAAVFVGPLLGFCKAIGRTAVGFYDTITFPLPLPRGYRPLIEPEFVMEDDN